MENQTKDLEAVSCSSDSDWQWLWLIVTSCYFFGLIVFSSLKGYASSAYIYIGKRS